MVMKLKNRTKYALVIVISLLLLGAIIWFVSHNADNQEPDGQTPIREYDQQIKNLPANYKSGIEGALRDMIAYNNAESSTADRVSDAVIRDGSATQREAIKGDRYEGQFIVDIESLRQSYLVQYEYSRLPEKDAQSGYPVLVTCLPENKLIYGDFICRERYTTADEKVRDPIVSKLPHATLSFRLSADATGEELILRAELRIPAMDLSGDARSRRQAVTLYKREVTNWMESEGFDPADYTITYNYLNDGRLRGTHTEP